MPLNMKNGGRWNVRKYIDTKNGKQYINLETSLKFSNMEKTKITSLEPK